MTMAKISEIRSNLKLRSTGPEGGGANGANNEWKKFLKYS